MILFKFYNVFNELYAISKKGLCFDFAPQS